MRPKQCVERVYSEAAAPKASAKVYDFGMRQKENRRHRRIKTLEQENDLLARVLFETSSEIARLRKLLTASDGL
jgi:hypothetical protein